MTTIIYDNEFDILFGDVGMGLSEIYSIVDVLLVIVCDDEHVELLHLQLIIVLVYTLLSNQHPCMQETSQDAHRYSMH